MSSNSAQALAYLRQIMIISTFGGLLFGYDTGVVNGALPYMAAPDQLNLTPLHEGMVVSILLLGCCVGSLFGGKLADMYGRRHNIIILAIIFFVAALGCSLAPSFEVMLVTRFTLGLAVGGASVTVPAYLAEVAPSNKRGRMVTQNELMIVTGQFLAFVFNAIIAIALAGDPHVWRYMLAVCAVPAVVLFFGMLRLPESPRWLVSKGKVSTAMDVLKKIRSTEAQSITELNEIQDVIAAEKSAKPVSFAELNTPWVRRIILIGMGIAACSQLTGVNSIMYYGTQVLIESGFSMQAALIANTLNGLTSVLATFLGIWLLTKIKRRTMLNGRSCRYYSFPSCHQYRFHDTERYGDIPLPRPFTARLLPDFYAGMYRTSALALNFRNNSAALQRYRHGYLRTVRMGCKLHHGSCVPDTFKFFRFKLHLPRICNRRFLLHCFRQTFRTGNKRQNFGTD